MVDKKRILRRQAERELDHERDKQLLIKHDEYLGTLLQAFYLASYGQDKLRFEGEGSALRIYLSPETDDHQSNPFADRVSTVLMLADPLLAFDEELSFEGLVDTLLTNNNDERVAELASYYALMGGECVPTGQNDA